MRQRRKMELVPQARVPSLHNLAAGPSPRYFSQMDQNKLSETPKIGSTVHAKLLSHGSGSSDQARIKSNP